MTGREEASARPGRAHLGGRVVDVPERGDGDGGCGGADAPRGRQHTARTIGKAIIDPR
ncbi:hypothetical protein [Streptomyces fungicidicus]|uniref:hypothetical protein n=1 Tax=Streptomyces fungicidicus TaxID=68203 RepID=UPI003D756D68